MNDPLTQLRAAGCPIDQLSSAQRAVLAELSEPEADVLASVYRRLADADGEVVAHDLKLL